MTNIIIDLYEYFHRERGGNTGGYLAVYVPAGTSEVKPKLRPAVLVVPGGGYAMCSDREAEPVAFCFLKAGYAAFVLRYTVNVAYPVPLVEAAMAMAYLRENSAEYGVDPEHVGVIGFSAGGHLAGMLATLFDDGNIAQELGERAKLVRPDAALLSYAVITTLPEHTHGGTAGTVSGGDPELRKALSIETRVTERSAPAFIWHTYEDGLVPVFNAVALAESYRKAGVPFELHIFEKGWHGLSVMSVETQDGALPEEIARNAVWVDLALGWLKARGFCVKAITKS